MSSSSPSRENSSDDGSSPDAAAGSRFSQKILEIGFLTGLGIAGVSLVFSSIYLFSFLWTTSSSVRTLVRANQTAAVGTTAETAASQPANSRPDARIIELAINSEMLMARIALLSCGVFVGMSFGFLGFSLFLIGIRGEMDVAASTELVRVKVARMSPGVFVITASVVLIGLCMNRETPFKYSRGSVEEGSPAPADQVSPGIATLPGVQPGMVPGGISPVPGPTSPPSAGTVAPPDNPPETIMGLPGVGGESQPQPDGGAATATNPNET